MSKTAKVPTIEAAENATEEPEVVAQMVPWIPLVPLLGAVLASGAYLIAWAGLVGT